MAPRPKQASDRRDERARKDTPEAPRVARPRKDRKTWCGGHTGREHAPECQVYKGWLGKEKGWRELVCTKCGKQISWYSPGFGDTKPAWVTQ